MARQHFPDNQTLRLQTGAGEDDIIHLPSGLDRVDCERQEEEEEEEEEERKAVWEFWCLQLGTSCSWDMTAAGGKASRKDFFGLGFDFVVVAVVLFLCVCFVCLFVC